MQTFDARSGIWENVGVATVGVVSTLIATVGGADWSPIAGMSFSLIGVAKGVHGHIAGSRRAELVEKQKGQAA